MTNNLERSVDPSECKPPICARPTLLWVRCFCARHQSARAAVEVIAPAVLSAEPLGPRLCQQSSSLSLTPKHFSLPGAPRLKTLFCGVTSAQCARLSLAARSELICTICSLQARVLPSVCLAASSGLASRQGRALLSVHSVRRSGCQQGYSCS